MKWLRKILTGSDGSGPPPAPSKGKPAQTGTGPANILDHSGLVVLPDRLHRLMESHLRDPAEQNEHLGNDLMNTGQPEEALPRLLAHGAQTSNPLSLLLAAQCCKKLVTTAAMNGTAGKEHDLLISSGIHLVDVFLNFVEGIDAFPRRGEPYSVRGGIFLIKAQLDKDRSALASAKQDYETAIKLGSEDPSNVEGWTNDLGSIETVRMVLF